MDKKKAMRDDARGLLRGVEGVIEVFLLSLVYYIVWRVGYGEGVFPDYYFNGKYVLAGVYAFLVFLVFINSDCFLFGQVRSTDIASGQFIGLFAVNFITYFQLCLIANGMVSPIPMLITMAIDIVVAGLLILGYSKLYHRIYRPHNMILVYGTDNAVGIKIKMDSRRDKYSINKLISVEEGLDKVCEEITKYDAVILNDLPSQVRNDILKFCYKNNIRTYAVPKISDIIVRGGKNVNVFDTPLLLMKNRKNGIPLEQRIVKRAFDILISGIGLIVASPIMAVVAIAIKLEDGGPVFYKQKRLTINEKEFEILKFRSMIVDAEKFSGEVLAADNDPRITKVGKFVRATRLDEIPQIINILKGDMSIVGPRPERRVFVDEYCKEIPEFAYRMRVKGGLTGFAQIYGKYNTSPYDKLRLDLMYIENYSLLLDIKLIILTVRIMFSKESTEGIDVAAENEKLKEQLLQELKEEHDKEI